MDDREDVVHVVVPSERVGTACCSRGGADVFDVSAGVEVEEADGESGTVNVGISGHGSGDGACDAVVCERHAQAEPSGAASNVRPPASGLFKVDAVRVGVGRPAVEQEPHLCVDREEPDLGVGLGHVDVDLFPACAAFSDDSFGKDGEPGRGERSGGGGDHLHAESGEEVVGLGNRRGECGGGDQIGCCAGPVLDDSPVDGVVVGTDALRGLAGGVVDEPEAAQVPPVVGGVGAVHVEREVVESACKREGGVVADHRAVRPAQHGGGVGVGDERPGTHAHVEAGDRSGLLPEAVERDTVRRDGSRLLDPQLSVARLVVGGGSAAHRRSQFHRQHHRVHDRRARRRVELVGDNKPCLRVVTSGQRLTDVQTPRLCRSGGRVGAGEIPHIPVEAVGYEAALVQAGGDGRRPHGEDKVVVVGSTGIGGVALEDDVDVAVRLGRLRQVGVKNRHRVVGRDCVGDYIDRCVQRDHHRLDVCRAGVVVLVGDVQRHRHVREVGVVGGAVDLQLEVAGHRRASPVRREVAGVINSEPQRHVLAGGRERVGVGHGGVRRRAEAQAEVLVGDRVAGRRVEVVDGDVGDDRLEDLGVLRQVDRELREVRRRVVGVRVQRGERVLDGFESSGHL